MSPIPPKQNKMKKRVRNAIAIAALPFAIALIGTAVIVTMTFELVRMAMQYATRDINGQVHGPKVK